MTGSSTTAEELALNAAAAAAGVQSINRAAAAQSTFWQYPSKFFCFSYSKFHHVFKNPLAAAYSSSSCYSPAISYSMTHADTKISSHFYYAPKFAIFLGCVSFNIICMGLFPPPCCYIFTYFKSTLANYFK